MLSVLCTLPPTYHAWMAHPTQFCQSRPCSSGLYVFFAATFDVSLQHIPGEVNILADMLSRNDLTHFLFPNHR